MGYSNVVLLGLSVVALTLLLSPSIVSSAPQTRRNLADSDCVHGKMVNSTCECDNGWYGKTCASDVTCPNDCSGHGSCSYDTTPPSCDCEDNWIYEDCSQHVWNPLMFLVDSKNVTNVDVPTCGWQYFRFSKADTFATTVYNLGNNTAQVYLTKEQIFQGFDPKEAAIGSCTADPKKSCAITVLCGLSDECVSNVNTTFYLAVQAPDESTVVNAYLEPISTKVASHHNVSDTWFGSTNTKEELEFISFEVWGTEDDAFYGVEVTFQNTSAPVTVWGRVNNTADNAACSNGTQTCTVLPDVKGHPGSCKMEFLNCENQINATYYFTYSSPVGGANLNTNFSVIKYPYSVMDLTDGVEFVAGSLVGGLSDFYKVVISHDQVDAATSIRFVVNTVAEGDAEGISNDGSVTLQLSPDGYPYTGCVEAWMDCDNVEYCSLVVPPCMLNFTTLYATVTSNDMAPDVTAYKISTEVYGAPDATSVSLSDNSAIVTDSVSDNVYNHYSIDTSGMTNLLDVTVYINSFQQEQLTEKITMYINRDKPAGTGCFEEEFKCDTETSCALQIEPCYLGGTIYVSILGDAQVDNVPVEYTLSFQEVVPQKLTTNQRVTGSVRSNSYTEYTVDVPDNLNYGSRVTVQIESQGGAGAVLYWQEDALAGGPCCLQNRDSCTAPCSLELGVGCQLSTSNTLYLGVQAAGEAVSSFDITLSTVEEPAWSSLAFGEVLSTRMTQTNAGEPFHQMYDVSVPGNMTDKCSPGNFIVKGKILKNMVQQSDIYLGVYRKDSDWKSAKTTPTCVNTVVDTVPIQNGEAMLLIDPQQDLSDLLVFIGTQDGSSPDVGQFLDYEIQVTALSGEATALTSGRAVVDHVITDQYVHYTIDALKPTPASLTVQVYIDAASPDDSQVSLYLSNTGVAGVRGDCYDNYVKCEGKKTCTLQVGYECLSDVELWNLAVTGTTSSTAVPVKYTLTATYRNAETIPSSEWQFFSTIEGVYQHYVLDTTPWKDNGATQTALNLAVSTRTTGRNLAVYLQKDSPAGPFCCLSYLMSCKVTSSEQCSLDISPQEFVAGNWYISVIDTDDDDNYAPVPFALLATPYSIAETDVVLTSSKNTFNTESHIVEADGLAKSFKIHVNETAPHGSQVVVHMHQDVSQHPGSIIHTTPIPLDVWVNTDQSQSQSSALTTCDEAAECTLSIDCFDLNTHDWVVTVRGKPVPNFFYVFSLNITYLTPATLKQGTSQQHVMAQTTRASVLDLSQQVKDPMTNPLRITINAEAGEGDLRLSSANSVAGVPSALGGYCYAQQDSCEGKNCSITLNPCQVAQNDYQSLWIGASAFPNTTTVNFNTVVEKEHLWTLTEATTYEVQPLNVMHILTNVPTHNSLYLAATNVEGSFTMSASQSGWPYKGCLDPDASTNCNGAACQLELQVCCTAKNMVFVTVENTGTKVAKFTLTPTLAPLTSLTSGNVTDGTVAVDQSRLFTFTSSPAADQHSWAPPIWVTLSGSTEGAATLDVSSTYCSEKPIDTCNVAKGDKCTVTLYPNEVVEPAYVARVINGASKSQDFKVEVTVGSPSIPAIGESATVSKTIFQQYVKTYTNGPQLATTAVKLNITGGSTSATLYINKGKPADPTNNLGKISVSDGTKEGTFSLDSCDVEAADYYFMLEADDDKGTYEISFTSSTPQPLKAKESLTLDGNKGSQLVYLNTAHNSFVNVHLANSTATLNSTITMYWQPVSYSENGVEVYPADSCSAGSCQIGDGKDNNDCYLFFGPEYMSNTILLRIDWEGTTPETISPVKLTYEDPEGLTQNLESGVHVDGKVDLPDFHSVYQMLPSAQLTEYENDYHYLAVDMYFECGDLTAYLWNADMGREDLVCAESKCSAIVPPCAYRNSTYYFVVAPKTETFEKVSTKFVLNATLYGVNTTLATTGVSFNATTPDPVLGGQFFTLDLSGYSSEGTNADVSTVALDGKSGDYNVYISPYGVAGPGCDNLATFNNKAQSGSVAACQMHTLPSRVASVFVQNANVTVNAFEPNALVLTNGTTRGSGVSDNFHSAVFAVAIDEVGPLNVLEVTTTGVDGQTTSLQTSVQDTGADTEGCNPLTKPIETCTSANCTFKTISNCDLKVGTYLIPVVNTGNQVAQVNATAITSVHHTPLATNSFRCVDASSDEDHHHYSVSGSAFDVIIQVTDGSKASMYFRQAGVASDGCADVTCSDASDCTAQYGDSTDTTVYFTVVAGGAYNIFVSPTEVSFVDLPVNTTIGGIVHSQPATQSVYAADFDLAFYNIVIPSVNTTWPCLTVEATATSGNEVEAGILLWPSNNLTKINKDPVCDFDPSATYVAVVRQTSSKEPNTTFAITVTMTDTNVINITGEGKASNMVNPTVFVYDVAATDDASEQYRTVNFIATHDGCGVDLSVTRSIGGDVVGSCTATDSSTCTVALNPDTIQEGSYYLTAGSKGIVCRDGSYAITVEDQSFNVTHALQVNANNDVVLVDNEVSTFSVSSLPSGATFLDLEFFLADSVLGALPYSVPILYNVSSTGGAVNGVVECSVSVSSAQSVWPEDTQCAPPVDMCAINATSVYYVSVAVDPDFVWPSGVSKVNVTVIPRADAPLTLGSSVDVSTRKFQHFFIGSENSASKTGLKISISNSTSVSMIRRTADLCSPTTTKEEAYSGAIQLSKCTSDGVCEVSIASAVSPATPESYIVVTRNSLVLLNNATANEEATTAFEAVNSCRSPSSLEFCDIGYNVWGSSDSDTVRDTAAQVHYRALIDAFSTAGADECASKNIAEECITAVKEYACFSSFRSCNGNGFVQGVCYDVCDKMYNACGELDQDQLPKDLQGGCQMDNTDCLGSSGSSDDKTVLTALLATGGGVVAVGVLVAVLAKKGVIFGGSGAAASSEPLLGGGGQAASGGGGGSNIAFFGNSG